MKKVLSVWKMIILVISALVGVAGVTVLSLYLLGQLGEEKVEPQDMMFENILTDGDGFYNSQLSQFEVSSDFKLTISTTTENVTEKSVTLSLLGASAEADEEGYISDGTIKVKKHVELNKPFEISLVSTYNQTLDKNWIMGGTSQLKATSSNVLVEPQTINIAVDCLVDSIDLKISDRPISDIQSVVVGETFTIDTIFYPTTQNNSSEYLYSDSNRKKEVFFDLRNEHISYDLETQKFSADTKSGNDFDTITAYTFASSYYQEKILSLYSSIESREDLTSAVLRYFKEHPETCVSKSIEIKVADVDVDKVEIETNQKIFNLSFDRYFTITANSSSADGTLGLSIKDSKGNSLNNLFANVGLKLPTENEGFDNLSFVGGKIVKVNKFTNQSTTIEKIDNVEGMEFVTSDEEAGIESISYYLLPNTSPKYATNYYWRYWVSSENNADQNFDFDINFFYEDENGNLVAFYDFEKDGTNDELSVSLSISSRNQGIEEKVGWTNEAGLSMTINFEEDGSSIPANVDLSKEITEISNSNLYQTIKYFIVLPNDTTITSIQDCFVCADGKDYSVDYQNETLDINNIIMPQTGYKLYELDGSILTAKKSLPDKVFVVAATIKTYADGKPYKTADGKYLIVKISHGKEVYVSSSLSIANMTPTFDFVDENDRVYFNDETGEYFVPSIVKNNSGENQNLIRFALTLKNCQNFDEEDATGEISKVLRAFNTPSENLKLYVENSDGNKQYVSLKNVSLMEGGMDEVAKTVTFVGVLEINRDLISSSTIKDTEGTLVKLNLVFEDGTNVFRKQILKANDSVDSFRIYNQQVCELSGSYAELGAGIENETIKVDVKSTGVKIEWGAQQVWTDSTELGTALDQFNENLVFEMKDQFGQKIYPEDGIYKVKFEETSGSVNKILSFNADSDKIQNFNTTNGSKINTSLTVYVVKIDASGNETKVPLFDADGNIATDEGGNDIALSSPKFNFEVVSEGVAEVWYNANNGAKDVTTEVWTKSSSNSTIEITRYVVSGDTFDLTNSIKIFSQETGLTGNPDKTDFDGKTTMQTEFYFDPTFLSGLEDQGESLRKMFSEIELVGGAADKPAQDTNLEVYRGKKIKAVRFAYPFRDEGDSGIEITFKATGANGGLFDITIKFVCVDDLSINTSAFDAYEETYKKYLVKDGNKISVFAGQQFNLDEYAKLSSATGRAGNNYSWASLYSGKDISDGYWSIDQTDIASIVTDNNVSYLKIEDVYVYTSLSVTLYYGPQTDYSCSITLNFYINPNIIAKQIAETQISLQEIAGGNVSVENYFEFYNIVGKNAYLDGNGNVNIAEDESRAKPLTNLYGLLSFTNESSVKYIEISSATANTNSTIKFDRVSKEIDFALGQSYNQTFYISYNNQSTTKPIVADKLVAVKVVGDGEESQIEINTNGIRFDFDIVLEESDDLEILTLKSDTATDKSVKTVVYGGVEYVLLLADETYNIDTDYSISEQPTGLLRKSGTNAIIVDSISEGFLDVDGNALKLSQTFKNKDGSVGELTATILLKAMVSGLGDKFVYYNNDDATVSESDLKFNHFEYTDAESNIIDVDLKDVLEISNENVYQILTAGAKYTILRNTHIENEPTTQTSGSAQDFVGFYFNGLMVDVETGASKVSLSVVENAEGYAQNLATVEKANDDDKFETILNIAPLSKEYLEEHGDVYVTLKFEIYKSERPTEKFVMYYRVKVNASYTLGEVAYPYSDNEEFMSETHVDFDGEKYVVDMEEVFDETNSTAFAYGKKRFASAKSIDEQTVISDVCANYKISSVKLADQEISKEAYFEMLDIDSNGVLTAKLLPNATNAQLVVTITKTLSLNDQEMIGSARDYVFKFNQGSVYTHSLSAKIEKDGIQSVDSSLQKVSANIYEQSVVADCGEILYSADMKIQGSNNSYTNVTDYKTYVKMLNDVHIEDAFAQYYKYSIKAGSTYFESVDATDGTETAIDLTTVWSNSKIDLETAVQNNERVALQVTIADAKTTIYVDANKVEEKTTYYYMDADRILHLTPKTSIAQDLFFEVGYYTDERVVFKVNAELKSYFNHILNSSTLTEEFGFAGGNTYSFFNESDKANSLFYDLSSSHNDVEIENFEIELTSQSAETVYASYDSEDIKQADLIKITNNAGDWKSSTIEFAHMFKDVSFEFVGKITESNGNEYKFNFILTAKADVSLGKNRLFDASAGDERYVNDAFEILVEHVASAIEFANQDENNFAFKNGSATPEYENKTTIVHTSHTDVTIYPTQVLTMTYSFNGKNLFDFNLNYKFKVAPSVAIESYHPAPDGTNEIEAEFVSTNSPSGSQVSYMSDMFENFFNSPAEHALRYTKEGEHSSSEYSRIDIKNKTKYNEDDYFANIGENWTILVSSITNVKLNIVEEELNINKTISSESADRTILQDKLIKSKNARPDIDLTFEVENSQSQGEVSFLVTINGVKVEYNVVVCLGSAYTVSHYAPNYAGNKETIYAEDLAKQTLEIFAEDRIASFTTKNADSVGTYVLRFVNKSDPNETITPTITIKEHFTTITNIDLGQSFENYIYEGTYLNETLAKAGAPENRLDDEIYQSGLKMTNRVVVTYGGVEIDLDNEASDGTTTLQFKQRESAETNEKGEVTGYNYVDWSNSNVYNKISNEYKVSSEYYEKTITLEAYLQFGGNFAEESSSTINLNSIYNYYLDIEFEVDGDVDDVTGYTTHILEANGGLSAGERDSYNLMDVVSIYNKRTQQGYGSDGLLNSAGTIDLQIYGFATLPVNTEISENSKTAQSQIKQITNEEDKLKAIAGHIHNYLINTDVEKTGRKSIRYYTGLIPTYKMGNSINSSTDNDFTSFDNYISISGALSGKTTDYKLFANASNNDGNHVMMRLSYTVDINGAEDGGVITRYYNLLFKVEPKSEIKFKVSENDNTLMDGAEETVENQTVVSNYQQIYQITDTKDSAKDLNLVLGNDANEDQKLAGTVWEALMYGSKKNLAKDFKYEITINNQIGSVTYNDLDDFETWLSGDNGYWGTDDERVVYTNKTTGDKTLIVRAPETTLGTRYYMIEIENAYGYRVRFYYQYISTTNPQILSMSSYNLTENTNLAFMAGFNQVTPTYYKNTPAYGMEHESFKYQVHSAKIDGVSQSFYNNTINVEKNTGVELTIKAYVDIQDLETETTTTYFKELNIDDSGYAKIFNSAEEAWTSVVDNSGKSLTQSDLVDHNITLTVSPNDENASTYSLANTGYMSRFDGGTEKYLYEAITDSENLVEYNKYNVSLNVQTTTSESTTTTTITESSNDVTHVIVSSQKELALTYSVAQEATKPVLNITEPDPVQTCETITEFDYSTTSVTLSGLSAYAFSKDIKLIDKTAVENQKLTSKVNDVFVQSVDFYYDGEFIGGSWVSTDYDSNAPVTSKKDENESWVDQTKDDHGNVIAEGTGKARLITDVNYNFVDANYNVKAGLAGNIDNNKSVNIFKVPYIEGLLFGTGSTLSNVTMNVTLRDGSGATTTISTIVSISRSAQINNIFERTDIQDGNSPVLNGLGSDTIINDTLEVTLEANSSVTFMIHNKVVTTIDETLTSATDSVGTFAPKLITLTNSNNYATTKYVGISSSIVGLENNFTGNENFYVYILDGKENATFEYNGNPVDIGVVEEKIENGEAKMIITNADVISTIDTYDSRKALTLKLGHANEVGASSVKNEKLYFLYKTNYTISNTDTAFSYQFIQNFSVYPVYTKAEDIDTSAGDTKITVDDYMVATNGAETYYMIPLASWAKDIKLVNEEIKDAEGKVVFEGYFANRTVGEESYTAEPAYKFYFKINDKHKGSAFIDENGMLTTTTTYDIDSHQMAVDIYMKVSGPDGKFQEANSDEDCLLGTFVINLNPNKLNENNKEILWSSLNYGTYNGNLVSSGDNWTITGRQQNTSISQIGITLSDDTQYAFQVGEKVNFEELFGKKTTISDLSNKNYHIVKDTLNDTSTYIWENNLNEWTFLTAGVHTIDVVVSGRANADTDDISYYAIQGVQVVVYDTAINEKATITNEATVDENGKVGEVTVGLGEGYTWYLRNEDGTVEMLENNNVVINEIIDENGDGTGTYSTGIFKKQFIAVSTSDKSIKNVVYTYFVYPKQTEQDNFSVVLRSTDILTLADLVQGANEGSSYEFYDENFNVVDRKSFDAYGANSTLTGTYYLHEYTEDEDGNVTSLSMRKINLTTKIASSDVTQRVVEFNSDNGLTTDIIETELKNALSSLSNATLVESGNSNGEFLYKENDSYTNTTDVWTYEIVDRYILKDTSNLTYTTEDGETRYYTTYLVSFRGAKSQKNYYYRFVFTFYPYQSEHTLVQSVDANSNYALTNLNTQIKKIIWADDENSETDEYDQNKNKPVRYFIMSGESLVEKSYADVSTSHRETYYVLIDNKYYKFDILICGRQFDIDGTGKAVEDIKSEIERALSITSGDYEIYYFNETDKKLQEFGNNEITTTTLYVKTGGLYYQFNVFVCQNEVTLDGTDKNLAQIKTEAESMFPAGVSYELYMLKNHKLEKFAITENSLATKFATNTVLYVKVEDFIIKLNIQISTNI